MAPSAALTSSSQFARLLRSQSAAFPEYEVWATVLESELSESVRSEIEAVLAEAVSQGLETLSRHRMEACMAEALKILSREREEVEIERRRTEAELSVAF